MLRQAQVQQQEWSPVLNGKGRRKVMPPPFRICRRMTKVLLEALNNVNACLRDPIYIPLTMFFSFRERLTFSRKGKLQTRNKMLSAMI